jgi:hypothetical protein
MKIVKSKEFFVELQLELRASCWLGLSYASIPVCYDYFWDRVLLFASVRLDHNPPIHGCHSSWDDKHMAPHPEKYGY